MGDLHRDISALVPGIDTKGLVHGDAVTTLCYAPQEYYSWADGRNPKGFCKNLVRHDSLDQLIKPVEGTVVVDIGAGPKGYGYLLACRANAAGYIGVDHYHAPALHKELEIIDIAGGVPATVPWTTCHEDMLRFLRRLPPKSASVLACGIDRCMIPEGHQVPAALQRFYPETTYLNALREECDRVLHPRGALISFYSFLASDPGQDASTVFTVTRVPIAKVAESVRRR